MTKPVKKLLLVIPIRLQDDLMPVVTSEGWHTVKDLFKKTGTSYNTHWNGNYVLDQDEIPWKASEDDLESLAPFDGRVIVIVEGKYQITDKTKLFGDRDGSMYVLEEDVAALLE